MRSSRPTGTITRGTTHPNRLRRSDRWIAATHAATLRTANPAPLVVDLGYGASPITVLELHRHLRAVRPDVRIVGLEIDPERVETGRRLARPGIEFGLGGFEIPTAQPPTLIRAFNVLRQYDEDDVDGAWSLMRARLAPDGVLVEGTCSEIGRVASWVALDREGPRSLTVSLHLGSLADPAIVAERLPKALIHRNVPGERVHEFVRALSSGWHRARGHGGYGARQQFVAAARSMREDGWPLLDGPARWRLGELTVAWSAVAPGPVPQTPGAAR